MSSNMLAYYLARSLGYFFLLKLQDKFLFASSLRIVFEVVLQSEIEIQKQMNTLYVNVALSKTGSTM